MPACERLTYPSKISCLCTWAAQGLSWQCDRGTPTPSPCCWAGTCCTGQDSAPKSGLKLGRQNETTMTQYSPTQSSPCNKIASTHSSSTTVLAATSKEYIAHRNLPWTYSLIPEQWDERKPYISLLVRGHTYSPRAHAYFWLQNPSQPRTQLQPLSEQASIPQASPYGRGTLPQQRASYPFHMTFCADKYHHCYLPKCHDGWQNRADVAHL